VGYFTFDIGLRYAIYNKRNNEIYFEAEIMYAMYRDKPPSRNIIKIGFSKDLN